MTPTRSCHLNSLSSTSIPSQQMRPEHQNLITSINDTLNTDTSSSAPEYFLALLDQRFLDVLQVLRPIVSPEAELRLEGAAVSLEQLIGHLLVLGLAGEEVEEEDDDADDHDDLHVEVLPVGPQVGGDVDNLDRLLPGLAVLGVALFSCFFLVFG